jgi:peroxiredoxin
MNKILRTILTAGAAMTLTTGAFAGDQAEIGQPAPNFTLTDTLGNTHNLSDFAGKVVVLEWTNDGCPYVRGHYRSGHMQQMQQTYTDKGVVWLSIASSAPGQQGNHSPADWEAIRQKQGAASTALLIDESSKVGRMYGAKTTPHMFVIDVSGTLVYDGAIDSGPGDPFKATNYVAAALDAVLAGKPVGKTASRPYGCGIKYARDS